MKYIAGNGDRLRDLVATVSELRHCPTFAAPGAVVVLESPSRAMGVSSAEGKRTSAMGPNSVVQSDWVWGLERDAFKLNWASRSIYLF